MIKPLKNQKTINKSKDIRQIKRRTAVRLYTDLVCLKTEKLIPNPSFDKKFPNINFPVHGNARMFH